MVMKYEIPVWVFVVWLVIVYPIFSIILVISGLWILVIFGIVVWFFPLFYIMCCNIYYSCYNKIKQSNVVDSGKESTNGTSVNPNRDAIDLFYAQPPSISTPVSPEAYSAVIFL